VTARTLEREWEETLLALEALEREHADVRRREQLELGDQDRARILALSGTDVRIGRGKASSFRPPLEQLAGEVGPHRECRRYRLLREVNQVGHVFAALALITDSLEQLVGGM
jgi:hypothetical protein